MQEMEIYMYYLGVGLILAKSAVGIMHPFAAPQVTIESYAVVLPATSQVPRTRSYLLPFLLEKILEACPFLFGSSISK
jgi:hypothetical protein